MYVVIVGNLSEGFKFYGPFDSFDAASDYSSQHFSTFQQTWVATLEEGK